MQAVYELAAEVRAILSQSETGELSDTDLEAIDRFAVTMDQKVDTYLRIDRVLDGWEAAVVAEMDRLQARKRSLAIARVRGKERLRTIMEVAGFKDYETALFKVWRQANPPAMPYIGDQDAIKDLPLALTRVVTTVSPDCKRAMEEYKATGNVPAGFQLKTGEHLRYK